MGNMGKELIGTVISDKMDKTVIVEVERLTLHPVYGKPVKKRSKFVAHDPENKCGIGDKVRIKSCRPISKTKRWKVVEVIEKAKTEELVMEEVDLSS
ncbi:MAG: 30S ribosomal protein S17 [Synergistetes bacterium]|nr:MAG: 30S ribosomal protein S17 [bacterium 42_11]MBC7331685.1 30S ribosomal protein S17 [Synergistota bacterium]MDK2872030.1 small subunit ribosomal protein [bacterium]